MGWVGTAWLTVDDKLASDLLVSAQPVVHISRELDHRPRTRRVQPLLPVGLCSSAKLLGAHLRAISHEQINDEAV
eukprot:6817010-Prymnesium_polylepis.1